MKINNMLSAFILAWALCVGGVVFAACPSSDFTGDCFVDFEDFEVLAGQWITVYDINDFDMLAAEWLTTDPSVPQYLSYIPDGALQMGDTFSEGFEDELPVHSVTVGAFFMGKYEVTNQQYCDFLNSVLSQALITISSGVVYKAGSGTNFPYCMTSDASADSQINYVGGVFGVLSKTGRDMSNDPMVMVTWYGAAAYCNWLSLQQGRQLCYNTTTWACDFTKNGYHLPTEAQWEYAARGGLADKRFPWGDTISNTQANFYSLYDISPVSYVYHPLWNDDIWPYTSPVGFFDGTLKNKADYNWYDSASSYQTQSGINGYGLYDMAGNVSEWCNDWFGPYAAQPQTDPVGPLSGDERINRGGAWNYPADSLRVSFRNYNPPQMSGKFIGFRLAMGY